MSDKHYSDFRPCACGHLKVSHGTWKYTPRPYNLKLSDECRNCGCKGFESDVLVWSVRSAVEEELGG